VTNNISVVYISSAVFAILGTTLYHVFLKKVPATMDPMVSVAAIYVFVLILSALIFPFFIDKSTLLGHIKGVGWIQFGIACAVICMELGFLLMYRSGWNLSTGSIVTGVVVSFALLFVGVLFWQEKLSAINIAGVLLCVIGVSMISYSSSEPGQSEPGQEELNQAEHKGLHKQRRPIRV